MKGYRFYADLPGTVPKFPARITVKQLAKSADDGKLCNVIALLLGKEHTNANYTQECLASTFDHSDSDTSLTSVSDDYLAKCRRIPEALARRLHPQLFVRLDFRD